MKHLTIILFGVIYLYACKKLHVDSDEYQASIAIVNSLVGPENNESQIKTNIGVGDQSWATNTFVQFYGYSDNSGYRKVYGLSATASFPINIVNADDTTQLLFSKSMSSQPGDVYTLFLAGSVSDVKSILIKEELPVRKDSVAGIRFMNLSPDSGPVSVNIAGKGVGSEQQSLAYLNLSDWTTYSATSADEIPVFEFRNAVTEELLAEFRFEQGWRPFPRFGNTTLIFRGLSGGSWPYNPEVVFVNH